MSQESVGLIVVHGIGNQKPGTVVGNLAPLLMPEGRVQEGPKESPTLLEAEHAGRRLLLHEANWSGLSNPDNEPVLRDARGLVPELYRSIGVALPRLVRPWISDAKNGLAELVWVLANLLLLAGAYIPEDPPPPAEPWAFAGLSGDLLLALWLVLVLALVTHAFWLHTKVGTLESMARTWISRPMVWGVRFLLSVLRVVVSIPLLFFVLPLCVQVLLIYPLYFVGAALVLAARTVSRSFRALGLGWLAVWVNRVSWAVLVFPIQNSLQSFKTSCNLVSIVLADRSLWVRLRALFWIPLVVAHAYLFLIISVTLVIAPVATIPLALEEPVQDLWETLGAVLVYYVICFAVLRLSLPVLDFLLDVVNYHLAPDARRTEYHEPIQRAHDSLRARGCREVHVLAHSLGTVLVFDWLKSSDQGYSIESLHTLGSPLDKFWYIDHPLPRREDPTGLADRVRTRWINFWTLGDFVSGRLRRFDAPDLSVENRHLTVWRPFPWSHLVYWRHALVGDSLRSNLGLEPTAAGPSER